MKTKAIALGLVLLSMLGTLMTQPMQVRAAVCSVSVVPSVTSVAPGGTFDVSIRVNTDTPTGGLQFVLNWDASKAQCNSITNGTYFSDFAAAHGGSVYMLPSIITADNTAGRFPTDINTSQAASPTVQYLILTGTQGQGPTGSGDVFILHMSANSGASGPVNFTLDPNNVILIDSTANANDLHATVNNAQVNIQIPPPTIAAVAPSYAVSGASLTITGTNFVAGDTSVKFNGVTGSGVSVSSSTSLGVTVPDLGPTAINGVTVTVTTSNGSGSSTVFNYIVSGKANNNGFMLASGFGHSVGLKTGGYVIGAGDNRFGQLNTSSWTNIVQIAAGGDQTIGLKSNGTVVATGDDRMGECDVSGWTGIIQVSAGYEHTVGLKADGTVVAAGDNTFGECNVSSWSGIVQVSAGYYFTLGLRADGTVLAVGDNSDGQWGGVSSWSGITQVSAGDHSLGLKADGTVVAVGWDGDGRCDVGSWSNITQVSAGYMHSVGLKSDGTVVATGYNGYTQCNVSSWTGIIQISAGAYDTLGLKADGTVVATGNNRLGQMNVTSWNLRAVPTTLTLTSAANPSVYRQALSISASVTPNPGGGTVQFQDNGTNLGTPVNINAAGQATYSIATLSLGNHTITAIYSGNVDFTSSTGTMIQAITGPPWDVNGDHVCDVRDLGMVASHIGQTGPPGWIPEDVNRDGVVDVRDLGIVAAHIGQTW